jgi:hypothetical protein
MLLTVSNLQPAIFPFLQCHLDCFRSAALLPIHYENSRNTSPVERLEGDKNGGRRCTKKRTVTISIF